MVLLRLYASACIHARIQPVLLYWVAACYRREAQFRRLYSIRGNGTWFAAAFRPALSRDRARPVHHRGRRRFFAPKTPLPLFRAKTADRSCAGVVDRSNRKARGLAGRTGAAALRGATSYFDKSRGSLLITGAHCDIQPSRRSPLQYYRYSTAGSASASIEREFINRAQDTLAVSACKAGSKLADSANNLPALRSPPPATDFSCRGPLISCPRSARTIAIA